MRLIDILYLLEAHTKVSIFRVKRSMCTTWAKEDEIFINSDYSINFLNRINDELLEKHILGMEVFDDMLKIVLEGD